MPVSELFRNSKEPSDVSEPMVDGIGPTKLLFPKLRYCSEVILPMVVGIELLMKFDPTSNLVILPKLPISDGRYPNRPSLSKSIRSTLA